MLINADFSHQASVTADEHQWIKSPQKGVERVMLDRIGAEKARATSLVRYAPNSYFPHHLHPSGEEILVLSGTFSADDDDYPAGWYLRNPPTSGHQPHSREGALIFVKLRQMTTTETHTIAIDTNDDSNWQITDNREVCLLYADDREQVSLQRLRANQTLFSKSITGGAEILVLAGELIDDSQTYIPGSWIRLPVDIESRMQAEVEGVTIYLKTGHLAVVIGADFA